MHRRSFATAYSSHSSLHCQRLGFRCGNASFSRAFDRVFLFVLLFLPQMQLNNERKSISKQMAYMSRAIPLNALIES